MSTFDARVLLAQGDAWQAEGRLRESLGGGAHEDAGARLASTGLPFAKWNSGDLVDGAKFDPAAVQAWYASRAFGAGVPWGLRVPAGTVFPFGHRLLTLACMAMEPAQFVRPPMSTRLRLAAAGVQDAPVVAALDAAAFSAPFDECDQWNAPHLGAAGFAVVLAYSNGVPVGTGTAVFTNDRAGRAATLFGIGVLAHARGRGIGAAVTAWLVERAIDMGATLVHLNPNSDAAARLYARIGFGATQGMDVYVDF